MAVMALPEKYRKRLRTTHMQERLNEEIRRRERVIRIFPNDESALRLIGALLAEQNETWLERKYLDMQEYHEWAAACAATREGNKLLPSQAETQSSFTGLERIYSGFGT